MEYASRRSGSRLAWLPLALAMAAGARAQLHPVGQEFQVNTETSFNQKEPDVAVAVSGDFVVVWQSSDHDGSSTGVFARRFSSSGARVASEFQVNTVTESFQGLPTVAVDSAANFVVAWTSLSQDGSDGGIFARRFSSTGAAQAAEFQVNSYTSGSQQYPSVAASAAGDFVVVWESRDGQDGANYGVFAQRFSSSGVKLGAEFQVNTFTLKWQAAASVAASASGAFVAVWYSQDQDGSDYGIFGRRFSSAGAALAAEFQVNEYTTSYQGHAAIAARPDGSFVVAWQSYQLGPSYAVFARRFSSAGAPVGGEFLVRAASNRSAVAISGALDFVLAWTSVGGDGDNNGVLARHYSSAGSPLAAEFQVNTYTAGSQYQPAAAADSDGDFVIVWTSNTHYGGLTGIFGRRFAELAVLDADGNGVLSPLTDGLLVLRFLFGFTDGTLTSGAVGAGCTRCDATAIEAYLNGLGVLVLDVDGNSTKSALTDGLLVLRFLFGFTGSTLTTGDIGGGCSRCDATAIVPYLAGLS